MKIWVCGNSLDNVYNTLVLNSADIYILLCKFQLWLKKRFFFKLMLSCKHIYFSLFYHLIWFRTFSASWGFFSFCCKLHESANVLRSEPRLELKYNGCTYRKWFIILKIFKKGGYTGGGEVLQKKIKSKEVRKTCFLGCLWIVYNNAY